jgi:hypothetical protein
MTKEQLRKCVFKELPQNDQRAAKEHTRLWNRQAGPIANKLQLLTEHRTLLFDPLMMNDD